MHERSCFPKTVLSYICVASVCFDTVVCFALTFAKKKQIKKQFDIQASVALERLARTMHARPHLLSQNIELMNVRGFCLFSYKRGIALHLPTA